jgi:hypothetical protein
MATVKIPDAVIRVLVEVAADVVSGVVKQLVEDQQPSKKFSETVEFPIGSRLRIRLFSND